MKVLIDGDKNSFYIYPKEKFKIFLRFKNYFFNQIGCLDGNFMNLYQGEPNNPDLTLYLNETDPQAVEINEEEYQIYCEMGSSFQLCKVSTRKLVKNNDNKYHFRSVLKMKRIPVLNRATILYALIA